MHCESQAASTSLPPYDSEKVGRWLRLGSIRDVRFGAARTAAATRNHPCHLITAGWRRVPGSRCERLGPKNLERYKWANLDMIIEDQ